MQLGYAKIMLTNMFTKEEIIKELQKCAKENGGKTPSGKTFFENTSVGIWDRMKYWPNYGELVREAGLIPNKFDKTKYNHEQLCKLFIRTIREQKKWPTRGILDVKHNKDPMFPDSSRFYNRLGKTKRLTETILEYCKNRKGYKDVIDICNLVLKNLDSQDETSNEKLKEGKIGWVYLFKHGKYNHYRVGRTFDQLRRGKEIAIQLPERPTLEHEIETVDPIGIETYWLNRFEKIGERLNADWFKLDRTAVREFKHWKKIV